MSYKIIAIAKSRDNNLTPEQRVYRIDRSIDDIKKPPSIVKKLKRFMTDPIIYPKLNGA